MNKPDKFFSSLWEMMEMEIDKAVAAEREACAKVCEDLDAWSMDDPGFTAAKAIRSRGQA